MQNKKRIESDSLGLKKINSNKLWGAQTQRSLENFKIGKDKIPSEVLGKFNDWMFGCDICQDVCPWNRFSKSHNTPEFNPYENLINYSKRDWEEISHEIFNEIFRKSAVKRTKFDGLKRNIEFLK